MKLTDFLQDVGRPVAYYPELRKITGSTNATILLCQFIYWRGKESDQNGWLYKTSDDIQNETGLSYGEQKTARRDLVEAGLLDEHYARLDHQMKFKLNLDAINDKWGKPQTDIPESGKPTLGNDAKPLSLNESEITAEITQRPLSIENAIYAGVEVTEDMVQTEELRNLAPRMFEKALGFSKPLPWWNGKEWTAFGEWVCEQYAKSKTSFGEYNIWRATPYTKGALANTRIRGFVSEFYDSWDMFQMSKGKQTDEARPEYPTIEVDTSNSIPNPNKKPRLV